MLFLPTRVVLLLPWNGRLYCPQQSPLIASALAKINTKENVEHSLDAWNLLRGSVMTSMVVSLDFIRIVGEVVSANSDFWNISQLTDLLDALEALHWHARSFNNDVSLRNSLHKYDFMRFRDDPNRLPHLLEQEVHSLSTILEIVLRIYIVSSDDDMKDFAEDWVHR